MPPTLSVPPADTTADTTATAIDVDPPSRRPSSIPTDQTPRHSIPVILAQTLEQLGVAVAATAECAHSRFTQVRNQYLAMCCGKFRFKFNRFLSVWWHRADKTPAYTQALDCSAHPQTSQPLTPPIPPTNQTHSHTHTHSANIITLGQGCAIGWMSSAVMTLKSAGSPLADGPASTAQISWIASTSSIGAGLGAILFGLVCGRLGSRNATWLCAVPLTVSVE